ncbi:hypothetical protein PVAND_013927 [Polypedilum vanderplanki]|uniref:Uncharacterized protein n=1 Tax=Polypedilum vanderplanki TaxID=319348 RepID=A0A9J6CR68_POLVA|nr:hypothetical protein PVAND_013927 [Polypedilum vanderplanki]
MKLSIILFIVLTSASISVNALWSSKCKDAETSTDKVTRFLQNANCTLYEKRIKLEERLKNLKEGLNAKVEGLKEKVEAFQELFKNSATTTGTGSNGLDYAIDVRMLKNDDDNLIENEEQEEEITTNIPLRTKRDEEIESEEPTTNNEEFHEIITEEEEEGTTVGVKPFAVLIAPTKCRPGQKLVNGRCRTLVFED